jgi:hypothetical protein
MIAQVWTIPRPRRGARSLARLLAAGLFVLLALFRGSARAGEVVTTDPNKVKAAFLRHFAHYVTWPTNTFATTNAPWKIGVLGDDPFGDILEKTVQGRAEQGRAFEIVRAGKLGNLADCQIVFIALPDAAKRRAALAALKDRPVLTVADAPEFMQEGGMIRFQTGSHVEMSINLDQARSAGLKIHSPLLEVTREVLENGAVRKLR